MLLLGRTSLSLLTLTGTETKQRFSIHVFDFFFTENLTCFSLIMSLFIRN